MTGDTMLSLTPLQLAEYQGARDEIKRLRASLASAEAERDALAALLCDVHAVLEIEMPNAAITERVAAAIYEAR